MTTPSSKPRSPGRFIPSEDIGAVEQWDFGDMISGGEPGTGRKKISASELAKYQAALKEGYDQGFAHGQAEGLQESDRRLREYSAIQGQQAAERLAEVVRNMEQRLADAEQQIAQGVLEMACEIARQVLRRELSVSTHVLQPGIREALTLLVNEGKAAKVRLNPMDLQVMGEALAQEFPSHDLNFVADPAVGPGGCLIESASSVVDATVARRWTRAIGALGMQSAWQDVPAEPVEQELAE